MFCSVYSLTDQIVALKEIRIQPEEGVPFTAIREGKSLMNILSVNIVNGMRAVCLCPSVCLSICLSLSFIQIVLI